MKKVLLFAVALCFMVSAQAQIKTNKSAENPLKTLKKVEQFNLQTAVYTQKLDSIIFAEDEGLFVERFEYDEHFRVKKASLTMGFYSTYTEYFYDDQDRLIREVSYMFGVAQDETEYSYNMQGWLVEAIQYEYEDGDWVYFAKTIYERNTQGALVSYIHFYFDDNSGQWMKVWREDYTYNSQGKLTTIILSSWSEVYSEWHVDSKEEYSYDSNGNCIKMLSSIMMEDTWVPSDKNEYEYDDNNNCILCDEYEYEEGTWVIANSSEYSYDLSVLVENIAGFGTNSVGVTGDDLFSTVDGLFCQNKLTSIETTDWEELQTFQINLYYSAATGLGENNEIQLVLWPNPVIESLNLNVEGLQQVEVFSMDGRQVMHIENGFETVNVSTLANGYYLLQATFTDGSKAVQKFVKE